MNPVLVEIYSTVAPSMPFIIGAYALMWVAILVYALIIMFGFKKAEKQMAVLEEALTAHRQMRSVEGEKLFCDIAGRADTIESVVAKVEERSPQTVSEYRARLEAKMREVLQSTTIDESRILTEAAIFADKIAVDEETVRLRSHLSQLRTMLSGDEPVGRKLDFLIQEVNRECNTIGSKCNDLTIARDVVNMKAEVEKIREQVQNIE